MNSSMRGEVADGFLPFSFSGYWGLGTGEWVLGTGEWVMGSVVDAG